MIKVSDYIATRFAALGARHVFLITGGGAMHLNDSFGHTPGLTYYCNHHEQACAIAAEGYARVTGTPAIVNVTSGPGGTNAITGVLGQWLDSIPAVYVSGQARTEVSVPFTGLPLRQLGDQEADIVGIVRPITKYAVTVTDPGTIRYHVEKAWHLARSGRPGPVWIDIPLDVQSAMVDETALPGFTPEPPAADDAREAHIARQVLNRIRRAERPVLLVGAGVRLAGAADLLPPLMARLNVPVLTAWDAIDLVPTDHPLAFGRPSTLGQRAANFVFQNADLLVSVGCRLNVRQIGYNFPSVARAAFKVVVDIDPFELQKPTLRPHLGVCCDARVFLENLLRAAEAGPVAPRPAWLSWCEERRRRYPPVLDEWRRRRDLVDPYVFSDALSDHLRPDDVVVSSDGAACVVPIQAMRLSAGQRHIVNSGCAAMGYGLPAAIGACVARGGERVICLEGDGSIQLNVQELQTLVHYGLPVKVFVFNNGGYLSIRNTQRGFFQERWVGEGPRSGVSFPDMVRIADAFGLRTWRIDSHAGLPWIADVLAAQGPALCDVAMPHDQAFIPRVASRRLSDGRMVSSPLEEMVPALTHADLKSNMLVPLWSDDEAVAGPVQARAFAGARS